MAQANKHWVQAMLHEDPYTPFPYFYDVTGWSNPLLFNVHGGSSGAELSIKSARVKPFEERAAFKLRGRAPSLAVYQINPGSTTSIESSGWLRYVLEKVWHLPYRDVTAADIAAGGLSGTDVLIVPNGSDDTAYDTLGDAGRAALVDWVNAGGRYIGWRGSAVLASRLGLSTATFTPPTSDVPGSLFRVAVDQRSPLSRGTGPFTWAYYEYDNLMRASNPADVAVAFPAADSDDFFVSGFATGEEELGGTAAVIDEAVGDGRAVVFSVEPNFRAFTNATQRLLWNAVTGKDPRRAKAAEAGSAARAQREARAEARAARVPDTGLPFRLSVRPADAARAQALLDRYGARYSTATGSRKVRFTIANPGGLSGDEHPFARALGTALRAQGVDVVAYVAP